VGEVALPSSNNMKKEELITLQNNIKEIITPCSSSNPLNMELLSFNEGVLEVRLQGSCSHCPAAQETFEEVVRSQIMRSDSRIKSVILNTEIDPELIAFAKTFLNRKSEERK